jgi:hypothetical protein
MERATKFGYGFLFVGAALPYLADKLFGPTAALCVASVALLLGVVFLIAAHHHDKSPIRKSVAMTIGLFSLYGAGLGALGGGIIGAIAHLRSSPHDVSEGPCRLLRSIKLRRVRRSLHRLLFLQLILLFPHTRLARL